MSPKSEVFLTLFKSMIYVFPFVAQGLNEIVMMTMVIMMITDFAAFCYSRVRMQEEISRPECCAASPLLRRAQLARNHLPLPSRSHTPALLGERLRRVSPLRGGPVAG
jgi:hypothetical protein